MSSQFTQVGGRLCLAFANTLEGDRQREATDRLTAYADLLEWAEQAQLLGPDEAKLLRQESLRRPAAADRVLDRAIHLREVIYHTVTRSLKQQPPNPADLETLNSEIGLALAQTRLLHSASEFSLAWASGLFLDRVLWPIAKSVLDLLTSAELDRVRECAAETCNDLFLDTTKNRRRRWCDMKVCGNRAKARRYRARR